MDTSAKPTKYTEGVMLPALHLSGLAGIVTPLGSGNTDYGLSIHQTAFPIVYFCTESQGFFPSDKRRIDIRQTPMGPF